MKGCVQVVSQGYQEERTGLQGLQIQFSVRMAFQNNTTHQKQILSGDKRRSGILQQLLGINCFYRYTERKLSRNETNRQTGNTCPSISLPKSIFFNFSFHFPCGHFLTKGATAVRSTVLAYCS